MKTSTRQTYFLPVIGLVDPEELKPGDLVGVNKDSYLVLETLPSEYDARVKAMEVDERPTEQYSDIGGLDTQIQELIEAIVLPMTHQERFEKLGIYTILYNLERNCSESFCIFTLYTILIPHSLYCAFKHTYFTKV